MRIPFTNKQITISTVPINQTAEEEFVSLAAAMTSSWNKNFKERNNLIPWIDWKEKQIFIAERSELSRYVPTS